MRKTSLLILSALMMLAFGAIQAQDNQNPITQGEFAVLLASNMNATPPNGGWKPQTAAKFLADQKIGPISGAWKISEKLTEGNLASMMRKMGLNFFSTTPDQVVTWAKANKLVGQYRERFMAYQMNAAAADDSSTTHIGQSLAGEEGVAMPAPATPSVP
jgi:hypothetical protein